MRLADYLRRTGAAIAKSPIETLRNLHLAHRQTILFENLDIQNGLPIRLDLDSLEEKMVADRRGGYCFEHNTLFSAALREVGFHPTTLLARVRRGPADRWMRTHMLLMIDVDGEPHGEPWIADVGFGGVGLLEPMPLRDGATSMQGGFTYSLRRDGYYWVLATVVDGAATDLYEFTDEPHTAGDVELANHYTSTHPDSIFRRTLTIQRSSPAERTILRGTTLSRYRGGSLAEESFERGRLAEVAKSAFGVELRDGPFLFERV